MSSESLEAFENKAEKHNREVPPEQDFASKMQNDVPPFAGDNPENIANAYGDQMRMSNGVTKQKALQELKNGRPINVTELAYSVAGNITEDGVSQEAATIGLVNGSIDNTYIGNMENEKPDRALDRLEEATATSAANAAAGTIAAKEALVDIANNRKTAAIDNKTKAQNLFDIAKEPIDNIKSATEHLQNRDSQKDQDEQAAQEEEPIDLQQRVRRILESLDNIEKTIDAYQNQLLMATAEAETENQEEDSLENLSKIDSDDNSEDALARTAMNSSLDIFNAGHIPNSTSSIPENRIRPNDATHIAAEQINSIRPNENMSKAAADELQEQKAA